MSDPHVTVDPQHLDAGSVALLNLSRHAESIRHTARRADTIDRRSWGALGETLRVPPEYERVAGAMADRLLAVAVVLDAHSDRLRAAATRYRRQDQATAAHLDALYPDRPPTPAAPHPDTRQPYAEPTSTEQASTGPTSTGQASTGQASTGQASTGTASTGPTPPGPIGSGPAPDAAGITADAAAFGTRAGDDGQNPFDWLAGSEYAFLRDFTDPLATGYELVTGEPARIAAHAATWREAADDLRELAGDLARATGNHLAAWHGRTGDRARDRLGRLARDIRDTAATLDDLAAVLDASATLIGTAQGRVTDRIVDLLGELIDDWSAAAAADATVPGAGAVAAEETIRKTSLATLECVAHARPAEHLLARVARYFAATADAADTGTAEYRRESADARALLVSGRYLDP
jgi:uncharacterized protein YukE